MKFKSALFVVLLPASFLSQNLPTVNPNSPTDTLNAANFTNPEVDELIKFAKTFLGTPYRYSGNTPSGFDCSGFIYYIMGNFGFKVTRTSYGMADLGRNVKLTEVRPGDLLFFKGRSNGSIGHVGMVVEASEQGLFFIHSSTSRGVVIDNFKTSKYYISRYLKAKRMDFGVPD